MKTRLNDLFDQMDNEDGNKLDDKIQIEKDPKIQHLIDTLKNIPPINRVNETYKEYFDKHFKNKYSSKQITKLSMMLNDETIEKFDMLNFRELLNFLIKKSEDSTHHIFTNHLNEKVSYLGNSLINKIIHVHGDVGYSVGCEMFQSTIFVDGNAESFVGSEMKQGKIFVKGNCDSAVGFEMTGGLIEVNGNCGPAAGSSMNKGDVIIKGNAGEGLGLHMSGGRVEVYGEIDSISEEIYGGNVFHKGKQIVRNGEILDRSYIK